MAIWEGLWRLSTRSENKNNERFWLTKAARGTTTVHRTAESAHTAAARKHGAAVVWLRTATAEGTASQWPDGGYISPRRCTVRVRHHVRPVRTRADGSAGRDRPIPPTPRSSRHGSGRAAYRVRLDCGAYASRACPQRSGAAAARARQLRTRERDFRAYPAGRYPAQPRRHIGVQPPVDRRPTSKPRPTPTRAGCARRRAPHWRCRRTPHSCRCPAGSCAH